MSRGINDSVNLMSEYFFIKTDHYPITILFKQSKQLKQTIKKMKKNQNSKNLFPRKYKYLMRHYNNELHWISSGIEKSIIVKETFYNKCKKLPT